MKEESEKAGLKLNIQKTKIMASKPKLHEEKWKQYQILFSWDTKPLLMLAAAMKLKNKTKQKQKQLLLGRKAMTNIDSILKAKSSLL